MPMYKPRSSAGYSKKKPTERYIWELAAKDAIVVPDLFSTLWITIAGILETIASPRRSGLALGDVESHGPTHTSPIASSTDGRSIKSMLR